MYGILFFCKSPTALDQPFEGRVVKSRGGIEMGHVAPGSQRQRTDAFSGSSLHTMTPKVVDTYHPPQLFNPLPTLRIAMPPGGNEPPTCSVAPNTLPLLTRARHARSTNVYTPTRPLEARSRVPQMRVENIWSSRYGISEVFFYMS
jgi:hypothetical protein